MNHPGTLGNDGSDIGFRAPTRYDSTEIIAMQLTVPNAHWAFWVGVICGVPIGSLLTAIGVALLTAH